MVILHSLASCKDARLADIIEEPLMSVCIWLK